MSNPERLELMRKKGGHRSQTLIVAIDGMEKEIFIIDIYALHLDAEESRQIAAKLIECAEWLEQKGSE